MDGIFIGRYDSKGRGKIKLESASAYRSGHVADFANNVVFDGDADSRRSKASADRFAKIERRGVGNGAGGNYGAAREFFVGVFGFWNWGYDTYIYLTGR